MFDPNIWRDIIQIIDNNRTFVITSHTNPDCDALGSELALAGHLRALGKTATILNSDAIPAAFRFLNSHPDLKIRRYSQAKHLALIKQAEVIVVLDASGGWDRLGRIGEVLEKSSATKICIDHHPDAADFVDVAVVDATAAATAELIYDLMMTMQGELTPYLAQALYAAIVTDTGSFRFPKTSPRTHRITAQLLAAGANPSDIYSQLYEQYPLERVRLKGHLIDSIKTEAGGQIAYYSLARDTLKAYGVKAAELDGFASLGQQVGGVRVTIFCLESTKSRIKISLRSDGSVPINQIAAAYGGGGHPSAAGATVEGKLDQVLAGVLARVKALLGADSGTV